MAFRDFTLNLPVRNGQKTRELDNRINDRLTACLKMNQAVLLENLNTRPTGLIEEEAGLALDRYGENAVAREQHITFLQRLWENAAIRWCSCLGLSRLLPATCAADT